MLCLCCVSTSVPVVYATQSQNLDQIQYIEEASGDIYVFEEVVGQEKRASTYGIVEQSATVRVYINGSFAEEVYANISDDVIRTTYPDGGVIEQQLSDVIKITDVETNNSTLSELRMNALYNDMSSAENEISLLAATDYIGNEPFEFSAKRVQATLPGASYYNGYQAMGYRSYTTYQNIPAYLQRQNGGVVDVFLAKRFEISPGTVAGTIVAVILAAFTPGGITASIVSSLVASTIGVAVDYGCSAEVAAVQFQWDYRVRINSNTGTIIAEHIRMMDFWEMYVAETDSFAYEYRPGYDEGTINASNEEMIRMALMEYLSGG